MDARQLQNLHVRIRKAQLPGYELSFEDGPNIFTLTIHGDGASYQSRPHSWDILMQWADELLIDLGA